MDLDPLATHLATLIGHYGPQFSRSSLAFLSIAAFFWNGDKLLSSAGRKAIWTEIENRSRDFSTLLAVYNRYFGPDRPISAIFTNIFFLSLSFLSAFVLGFSFLVPEFQELFLQNAYARSNFLYGIATEGFLTVFVVNYVSIQIFNSMAPSLQSSGLWRYTMFIADLIVRLFVFVISVAVVYVISAELFGSFSGNPVLALSAVGPTLQDSVLFSNITGAYLYASVLPAFPLLILSGMFSAQHNSSISRFIHAIFYYLPFHELPIRSAGIVLGVFFMLVSLLAFVLFSVF